MHGWRFLLTWLAIGMPSAMLAFGAGCLLHWSTLTVAILVAVIEAVTVMSGVFCVAARQADERMRCYFES